jgi:glycosyltransferase involved in cell wall biosynthesis
VVLEIAPEVTEAGLRNAALERARGDYVTFLVVGDQVAPGGLEDLIDAHEAGHDILSARTSEQPAAPAGWARLLLDGVPPDSVCVSFAREPLRAIGGFADDALGPFAARAPLDGTITTVTVSSVTLRPRAEPTVPELLRHRVAGLLAAGTIAIRLGRAGERMPQR